MKGCLEFLSNGVCKDPPGLASAYQEPVELAVQEILSTLRKELQTDLAELFRGRMNMEGAQVYDRAFKLANKATGKEIQAGLQSAGSKSTQQTDRKWKMLKWFQHDTCRKLANTQVEHWARHLCKEADAQVSLLLRDVKTVSKSYIKRLMDFDLGGQSKVYEDNLSMCAMYFVCCDVTSKVSICKCIPLKTDESCTC